MEVLNEEFIKIRDYLNDEKNKIEAQKKALDDEYNAKKMAIFKKLSDEGKAFKVGDIVQDQYSTIVIEDYKIANYYGKENTLCYWGHMVKKDLTPKIHYASWLVACENAKLIKQGD